MLAPVGMLRSRLNNENPHKERRRQKKAPRPQKREISRTPDKRDGEHIDITA